MSEKTTLLSEAETEFTHFKRAIAGLDEARMRQVWLGTWSVRDIVAHISGWHREMGPALERLARGERPIAEGVSYEDVDAWNGRFAEAKRSTIRRGRAYRSRGGGAPSGVTPRCSGRSHGCSRCAPRLPSRCPRGSGSRRAGWR